MTNIRKSLTFYYSSEIFLSLGIGLFSYAQPFFYQQNGLNDHEIGLLFAVNAATAGVVALTLGSVADRIGVTRVFKFSTLLLPFAMLLLALTHSFTWWMVSEVLRGAGAALLMATENVVLSSLLKGREKAGVLSQFMALYTFIIGTGIVLSGFASGWMGYRHALLLSGIVGLCAPVIRLFVKAEDARSDKLFRMPSRRVMAMCLYTAIFGLALGLFNPFATLVIQGQFGLASGVVGTISAVSTFMVSIGALLVSPMIRRLNHQRTLAVSFIGSILVTELLAWTGRAIPFVGLYLGRTMVTSVPGSIVDAMFLDMTHETEYAQMFGVRIFGNNVGTAAGSASGGILLDHHALPMLLTISACVLVLAFAYLTVLIRKRNAWKSRTSSEPSTLST